MPDMANITVKKNDGTTDQLYTAVQASGGDKSPAVWRNLSVGSAVGFQPSLQLSARSNGQNTARRLDGTFAWPTTVVGADGKVNPSEKAILSFSAVVPLNMPTTDVNEAVAQSLNLFAASLIKSSVQAGYAPA